MKKTSRIISILLSVLLLATLVAPVAVFAAEPVYTVAGDAIFGNWDASANVMTKGADGKYTYTVKTTEAVSVVNFKVVENGTNWIGDADGNNISFGVKGAGEIKVTFDPTTKEIKISGSAYAAPTLNYSTVTAVGNGSGNFLNGASWDPAAASNHMTEVEKDVWEIEYKDVAPAEDYQVKFALDDAWSVNFGGTFEASGAETAAVLDGYNIYVTVVEESTMKLRLDLRNFDLDSRSGATFTVTVTPKNADDAYYVVGTEPFGGWNAFAPESKMTLEDGKYVYTLNAAGAADRVEFKVVKLVANDASNKVWYGNEDESNVAFGLSDASDVKVTFDPETNKITVTGANVTEPKAAEVPAPAEGSKQTGDEVYLFASLAAVSLVVVSVAVTVYRKRRIEL